MEWDIAVESGENNLRSLRALTRRVTNEVALGVDKGHAIQFFQGLGPFVPTTRSLRATQLRPAFVALDVASVPHLEGRPDSQDRTKNLFKSIWGRVRGQAVGSAAGSVHEVGRPGYSNAAILSLPVERAYNPYALDPEPMLAALSPHDVADASKRFAIKHRSSVLAHGSKDAMNQLFAKRHPDINPTCSLSKLRSLKLRLFRLVHEHSDLLDPAPMACAWIYFERMVVKGLVTKTNRRSVLSACIILAFKYNQDQRFDDRSSKLTHTVLPEIFDREVHERDILRIEFDVFASLGFDLWVSEEQAEPHILHYYSLFRDSNARPEPTEYAAGYSSP